MPFRVVTLNLEQDHKRWEERRPLIEAEIARLKPDVVGFNEVSIPLQTARNLRRTASAACGRTFNLVQQTRVNGLSEVEGEALLSSFPVLETGNLDFRTQDIVALVARLDIGGTPVDVYVTHLYRSVGDDSLRLFQAQKLLAWIESRDDVGAGNRLRRFQCDPGEAFGGADGDALSPDSDGAHGLHAACRRQQRDLASLLAKDGSLHRLHLGVGENKGRGQRHMLRPRQRRRCDPVAVRSRRRMGRPGACPDRATSHG